MARKKKYEEVYKVVILINEKRVSGFINTLNFIEQIIGRAMFGMATYTPGGTTIPRDDCGPLCTFSDLEQAILFMVRDTPLNTTSELWRARAHRSRRTSVCTGKAAGGSRIGIRYLSSGTILADEVILDSLLYTHYHSEYRTGMHIEILKDMTAAQHMEVENG